MRPAREPIPGRAARAAGVFASSGLRPLIWWSACRWTLSRLSNSAWRRLASSSFSHSFRWLLSTIFSCFWSWSARPSSRSCCLSRCRSRSNSFWRTSLSCSSIRRFFAKGQLLGLDFGLFAASTGLDLGLFENLPGFLFGVLLAQIADQLDDAHSHNAATKATPTINHGLVPSTVCWAKTSSEI